MTCFCPPCMLCENRSMPCRCSIIDVVGIGFLLVTLQLPGNNPTANSSDVCYIARTNQSESRLVGWLVGTSLRTGWTRTTTRCWQALACVFTAQLQCITRGSPVIKSDAILIASLHTVSSLEFTVYSSSLVPIPLDAARISRLKKKNHAKDPALKGYTH